MPTPFSSADLALVGSTFLAVFLAELGDKTQLATVAISGTSKAPVVVFAASASALVLASLIGALAGARWRKWCLLSCCSCWQRWDSS